MAPLILGFAPAGQREGIVLFDGSGRAGEILVLDRRAWST